jgi:hypothetical protein
VSLQAKRKDGAAGKAIIVLKAQLFFVISLFSVHDGVIFSRERAKPDYAYKGDINE